MVDRKRIDAAAKDLLSRYGLNIDVRAELSDYSVAVQQIVAIARAVELSGKVLVLDEPTASLDRNEVQRLFDVVRSLKAKGLAIMRTTSVVFRVFSAWVATFLPLRRIVTRSARSKTWSRK